MQHVFRRKTCKLNSADDRRHFVTLSVRLCLECNGLDAARRADLSVAAETCLSQRNEHQFSHIKHPGKLQWGPPTNDSEILRGLFDFLYGENGNKTVIYQ